MTSDHIQASAARSRWPPRAVTLAGAAVFVVAFCARFGAIDGLGGDDHWSLWNASAFLHGDLPYRGFVDMGNPLHWFMSAVVQWLVGYRIVGEVLLGSILSAAAITLAFWMAWEASGSLLVAVALTLVALAEVTVAKLYSYPKIFVYPLGLWAAWRYIDKPTAARAFGLAAAVIVAFGYRHDHGAYVGVACALAVAVAHWGAGVAQLWRPLLRFVAFGTLIVGPYLAWIQVNEGLVPYLQERATFARKLDEAGRRAVPWVVDATAPSGMFATVASPEIRVAVAWVHDVGPTEQASIERRYGLMPATTASDSWVPYIVTDLSDRNLHELMADTRVGRVDGIGGSFRLVFRPQARSEGSPDVSLQLPPYVADGERHAIAERYGLRDGRSTGPGRWVYSLSDTTEDTLMALATDRRVSQLVGLERVIDPVVVTIRDQIMGAPVGIRWKPDVSESYRLQREEKYHLVPGVQDGRSFRYQVADTSIENITELSLDPAVEDTDGIAAADQAGRRRVLENRPAGGRVRIRWDPGVSGDVRRSLEQHYSLHAEAGESAFVPYTLRDLDASNVRALLAEPRAVRTSGIDPATLAPSGESFLVTFGRTHAWARLRPWPRVIHERNAGVLLYYIAFVVPFLVLALVWLVPAEPRFAGEAGKMLVAGVMGAIISLALFRKLGYFPDHADVTMVLVAWVGSRAWGASWPRLRTYTRSLVGVVAVAGLAAVYLYVDLPVLFERTGLARGIPAFVKRTLTRAQAMAASPPIDYYAPAEASGDRALIRYFHDCTRQQDRIWVTSDVYTIPYYAERRFVNHIFWGMGFMASADAQRKTLELLEREPVPFIFGVGESRPFEFLEAYPQVHDYVVKRYTETHAILQDELNREGRVLWLAVDGRRKSSSIHPALGLPCFREPVSTGPEVE